ncbi:MAG TPA: alpha/beta hydrolase, partial [Thermomicrobiales bacterium]|nr:alpha/beta hydrolase [Thermomicrobiales bacterium]
AGWSYGAHVTLAFALEYPERIRTLTLIEPPAVWIMRETGWNPPERARIEAFDRGMTGRELTADDLKAFLVRAGFGPPETDFEALPTWPSWLAHRQALAINGTIWDYRDTLDRLRELRVPVLAILRTESPDSFKSIVETIVTTAPSATLLELPGNHACHLQNPDRLLFELEAHLDT